MKKVFGIIGVCLLVIVALWSVLVTIDCIRLKNKTEETKPLISLVNVWTTDRSNYSGLGYTVEYYCQDRENLNDKCEVYGAEFRIFDKILVWAWVS